MRCGICGKDTMLGNSTTGQALIRNAADLNWHKATEHRAEYLAAIAARRTKAQTARQAKGIEAQRVSDARLAASRPVVVRYHGEGEAITYPSSKVARYQVSGRDNHPVTDVRFPDAEAYQQYERIIAEVTRLEAGARELLTLAWEMGRPVTLEHLDELARASSAKVEEVTR